MRKLLLGLLVVLFFVAPAGLSLLAKQIITEQLLTQLPKDTQVDRFEFSHGWLNSTAKINLKSKITQLNLDTVNQISHGPIIWKQLFNEPSKAFALYQIDSRAFTHGQPTNTDSNQIASAQTTIDYFAKSYPSISLPQYHLAQADQNLMVEGGQIDAQVDLNSTINAQINLTELNLNDSAQALVIQNPQIELEVLPDLPIPTRLKLSTELFSHTQAGLNYRLNQLKLSTTLDKPEDQFQFQALINSDSLIFNQNHLNDPSLKITLQDLHPELINYIRHNYQEFTAAVETQHLLKLLNYAAEFVKLTRNYPPKIDIDLTAESAQQPLRLNVQAHTGSTNQNTLDPFSLLHGLTASLKFQAPKALIDDLINYDHANIFTSLHHQGFIIEKQNAYLSDIQFTNAKLIINHL